MAAGDLDGSGKQDILATEASTDDLYLYLCPGTGATALGSRAQTGTNR
ncbi:hypothetical protein [Streptomyces lavendulae]